jgi:phage terminase large subunit-like protein
VAKRKQSEDRGQRAVGFINKLTHAKGREYGGQPFALRPWQEDIVRRLFGTLTPAGKRQYRTALLMLPRKNGKALAVDTPIPTPKGWAQMGDLQPGDVVFDERGRACSVVAVGPVQHGRPCYRLSFGDGTAIVADEQHEWLADHRDWSAGPRIVTTAGIKESCRIPVARPLDVPAVALPLPPYTLGAWLGDGRNAGASLSSVDEEIYDAISAEGIPVKRSRWEARLGGDRSQAARDDSVQARLRAMGLLNAKRIPAVYQRSGIEQRYALLRGLMDTDGYCSAAGQCEFTTTYQVLAVDVLELVRGLGMKASCTVGRAMLNGKDCGAKYRVQFWAFADVPAFSIVRKVSRQKARPRSETRATRHYVQSIEPVDSVPVRCIQVDSPSRLFLAGEGMVPTHNSELAAAIALYGLLADGEIGAEVYSAAADRDQAALVFNVAAQMIRNDAHLESICEIIESQKRIVYRATGSFYRAISAEAYSKHGFNASMVVYDELHAAPSRDLWDVLATSQGARDQPVMLAISTAGYDRHSILWELYAHAKKVQENPAIDPTFLPVLYEAAKDANWLDEKVWAAANPALGDFRSLDEMRTMATRAKEIPAQENAFRRLYLNQWTEQAERWIPMDKWDALATRIPRASLRGRRCYVGMDLSSTRDLTALVAVFPADDGTCDVLAQFFVPDDTIPERERRDRVPYAQWKREGHLTGTSGNVVDYERVRKQLQDWRNEFDVREIAYDPWNATDLVTRLTEQDGFTCVPVRQGYASLSSATKELEKAIVGKTLRHDGHPVLRWNVSNAAVEQDPAGNIKLSKKVSTERIDGAAALVNAVDRMTRNHTMPATLLAEWV